MKARRRELGREKAREGAARLLADVREAVSQQRGSRRIDLSAALQALADGIASTRIELDIACEAARDLSPRVAHALLRCVQEAVTNSVRHARATRVHVVLGGDGDREGEVRLSIDDDGDGAIALRPATASAAWPSAWSNWAAACRCAPEPGL